MQSGTKTTSRSAVQARLAVTGCSSGHAPLDGPTGLPNNCLTAAATALIGFQSAIARSQAGMPEVGTNTLDSIVIGKIRIEACAAVSSLPITRPRYMPTQIIAN